MLEGVLAAGGTATEASCPATRWPARPAPPRSPRTATYSKTKFVASFIGFAPGPQPASAGVGDGRRARGDIYGGTVAAPAFERIMAFALPYLRIPPE